MFEGSLVQVETGPGEWASLVCACQRPPDQPYLTEPLLSTTVPHREGAPKS